MKYLILIALVSLVACQDAKKQGLTIEKVAQSEDELFDKENLVLVPNIKGVVVNGSNFHKEGEINIAEDIQVINQATGKAIDEFSMLDWGPVAFKNETDSLKVYPDEELEITYRIHNSEVIRKVTCTFKPDIDASKFDQYLAQSKGQNPDWEAIYYGIFRLAAAGHKASFDFFMNPTAEQKKLLAHTQGGASTESIYRVLNFMKKNGCNW